MTTWKYWTWLDDGLLPILVALLRACWLWPWLLVIQRVVADTQDAPLLPWWVVIVLPLISLTLTRWLAENAGQTDSVSGAMRRSIPVGARVAVALGGLVAIGLVLWWRYYAAEYLLWNPLWLSSLGDRLIHWQLLLPAPLLTLLVTAWLWQAGLADALRRMSHDDIWRAFSVGLGALMLYLLASVLSGSTLSTVDINRILLFFGLGMSALAFSSLKITTGLDRALGAPGTGLGSQSPRVNRYWLLNTALVVAGLLLVALFIIVLVAPETLNAIFAVLQWVVGGLLRIIALILLGVAYVMAILLFFLMRLLEPFIQRLMERLAESPLRELLQSMQEIQESQPEVATDPAAMPDSYRWLALTALLVAVALAFALALRRLRAMAQGDPDEERESILSADLLQDQLGGLFSRLLSRLRGAGAALNPFLSLEGERDTRRTIRHIYQHLLAGAEEHNHARHPSQTPSEYGRFLEDGLRMDEARMATVTAGYLAARYAPDPPTEEQASGVAAAWEQLRHTFEKEDDEDPRRAASIT